MLSCCQACPPCQPLPNPHVTSQPLIHPRAHAQRVRLWQLYRQRPGVMDQVIQGGNAIRKPNLADPRFWLNVLDNLRLTPQQHALMDIKQAEVIGCLHAVRPMEVEEGGVGRFGV